MKTMTTYHQRSDYMAGRVTFEDYYSSVAKAAHISYANADPAFLASVRQAIADGDEHLNRISLPIWDGRAIASKGALARAFALHGDFYSLAGGVCVHKQAAKNAVEARS